MATNTDITGYDDGANDTTKPYNLTFFNTNIKLNGNNVF